MIRLFENIAVACVCLLVFALCLALLSVFGFFLDYFVTNLCILIVKGHWIGVVPHVWGGGFSPHMLHTYRPH